MRRTIAALACVALTLTACNADRAEDAGDTTERHASDAARPPGVADESASDVDALPEPREAFPFDVTFADHGVAGFVATRDLARSTFATDADTASFALAQAWLDERGVLPPAEAIRPEEWVNAVDHDYPDPAPGDTWRVESDLGAPWWTPADEQATQLLRVGIQGVRDVERRPVVVTLVVDTSGSMSFGDRLSLVQDAVFGLLAGLGPEDRVALVEYGTTARTLVEPTADLEAVAEAVRGLSPSGSTNAEEGLRRGFELARGAHDPEATNTVVLLSDGVANVGATGPDEILERVVAEAADGITLHSVGVGMDNYHDVLLERLANDAGGSYAYIDRPGEAAELFAGTLPVLDPIAHDVKAQVELDPAAVVSWRLVGYENRLLAEEDLRDDTVGGGYVGAGHSVTALYELELVDDATPADELGAVTIVWDDPASGEGRELTTPLVPAAAEEGTFATAAGVAAAAEHLRGSPHVTVDLAEVADRLAATGRPADARLADLVRRAEGAAQPTSPPRQQVDPPGITVEDRTDG
ncbi:DUF3520 domain-containing protein [Nitriliruptoraceae bacterium ZYF776]|nr:DUF3520 domain-containing protein [Profundirhabdus halotolerans]